VPLKNVLPIFSYGWQTCITPDRHVVHFKYSFVNQTIRWEVIKLCSVIYNNKQNSDSLNLEFVGLILVLYCPTNAHKLL